MAGEGGGGQETNHRKRNSHRWWSTLRTVGFGGVGDVDGDVVPGHGLLGFYLDHIHGEAGVPARCPVIGRLARALGGLNLRHLEPGGGGSGGHRGGGCLRWGGWVAGGRGLGVHVPDANRRFRVEGLKGLVSFLEAVHCVGVERVNSVKTAQRCTR